MSDERWTHPLALEVSRIVHALPRGNTRREDLLNLADRIECEFRIRASTLQAPDDLIALRDVLDKGHNIGRADAYALLNYIERGAA